ncbi:MAG: hypothetical protein IJM39_08035 [Firmicutes bacterium]|nr:hypothetical protein [Bacillota bacterium]
MLTKHTNEYGVITLDEGLMLQIFAEAIKPWEGKVKYAGDREFRLEEGGLFAYAPLSIKIGCSISEICGGMIEYIAGAVQNSLELPLSDIVLEVVQMTTSKKTVKRDIKVSYRGGETEEEQQ